MQKLFSEKQSNLRHAAIVLMLALFVAATTIIAVPPVRAQQPSDGQKGYGLTTGVVGIVKGQTARLIVWNKGKEPVLVRLQFVNPQEEAFVPIRCDAMIDPGKYVVEEFPGFGGQRQRTEFQAQFGTNASRSIGLLVPTLQIIDDASGATSWMIGQEGFTEFRPIFVPPLVAPW